MFRGRLAALCMCGLAVVATAGAAPLQGSQAADQKPVRLTAKTKPPKKVKDVKPVYPAEAKKAGLKGTVVLEITVDKDGKVEDTKVLRSAEGFDQAAIDAVKQWEFEPTVLEGKAVPVIMTVTVNFQPKKTPPAPPKAPTPPKPAKAPEPPAPPASVQTVSDVAAVPPPVPPAPPEPPAPPAPPAPPVPPSPPPPPPAPIR